MKQVKFVQTDTEDEILYIPHGSDETNLIANSQFTYCFFISHTVQMKHKICWVIVCLTCVFISHTVQMKPQVGTLYMWLITSLYPTRFRWNLFRIEPCRARIKSLYPTRFRWNFIPTPYCSLLFQCFISHTVQMKQRRSWFSLPSRVSLYPTRFRWNNKGAFHAFIEGSWSLYPTRFRWNI